MRRQELIYAQNDGFARNKDILNVSTSSDVCVFESPTFDMTGATKMLSGMTSGSTGIHLVETNGEPIDLTFQFSGVVMTLDTVFGYDIYKYDDKIGMFKEPYVLRSSGTTYSDFYLTNILSNTIETFNMADGEYIIKPTYDHKICTEILGRLGVRMKTNTFTSEGEYNLYNPEFDYYFATIFGARQPIFDLSPNGERPLGSLNVISIIPEGSGQTTFTLESSFNGSPVVTLNGVVLAPEEDYFLSGETFTLVEPTFIEDILTIVFIGAGSENGLVAKSHVIGYAILQGPSNLQGDEVVYFNTTTNKYEFFLDSEPVDGSDIMVSLNGAVLANNVDYYQSSSDKKRIIFEGVLAVKDIVTVVYNSKASYVGGVSDSSIDIYWTIDIAPSQVNGKFILQVSDSKDFTNIISSGETLYVIGSKVYNNVLSVTGTVGDKRYYRIINEKNYVTILGDIITTMSVSEVIPIVVQTNSSNNY